MIGQKAYSLRDKHAGLKPGDVRVAESQAVVKARLALMNPKKKKKGGAVRRAVAKISKVIGKK